MSRPFYLISAFALASVAPSFGQYSTAIVAGGGPPDGAAATSIALSDVPGATTDTTGNVYIPVRAQNRVYRLAANGSISTVAGNGVAGFSGDGGPAIAAQLNSPTSVAVDNAGNLYIADSVNFRVRKVSGGVITTVAGNGLCCDAGDFGPAINAQINLSTIAVDGAGNLYIAGGSSRIRKIANGTITPFAGNGVAGYSGDGGLATIAQIGFSAAIAADAGGKLYIADTNNNRIREVSNGIITTVAGNGTFGFSGDGGIPTAASLASPGGIAIGSTGDLYISDSGNQRIRRVSGGVINTVAGNGGIGYFGDGGQATIAQLNNPFGIAVDNQGNLYIADQGNSRLRKVSGGVITTVAGNGSYRYSGDNGPATSAQLDPSGLAVDPGANLFISDLRDNRIRRVAGGIITTVAGNGTPGYSGDGGPANAAQLNYVSGIAADGGGNLYLADSNNNRVRKVTSGIITTVAGNGGFGYSGDGGQATSAQISAPQAVAVDAAGTNLYVAQSGRVRKVAGGLITLVAGGGPPNGALATNISVQSNSTAVDAAGNLYVASFPDARVYKVALNGTISIAAGNGTAGFSGDGGLASNAQIFPVGVAVDSVGDLYIADGGNGRVRRVSGGIITTVAGGGNGCPQQTNPAGDNCTPTSAYISYATGVAVVGPGTTIYISDSNNCRIRRVSGGVITTVAGTGTCGFFGDGGPATSAQISYTNGITADSGGNFYFADSGNCRIRKVSGGAISTVAGNGQCGYGGDGGAAISAQVGNVNGVAVDVAGNNLYIADPSSSCRIRRVSGGVISTVAGTTACGFSGEGGLATSAELNFPGGVTVDAVGNLYIADQANYRVRKVVGGVITTVAGNGSPSYSGDGGSAIDAQIGNISGLAIDGLGNLYVADAANGRVRVVTSGGTINTFAGGGTFTADGVPATSALLSPGSIAAAPGQVLYIVDRSQRLVKKVSAGVISTVTTIAVAGSFPFSGDGGVAVDSAGKIYVSDPPDGRVRQLTPIGSQPILTVSKIHSASFFQGQQGATYSITVTNSGVVNTNGNVTVTDVAPAAGLTLVVGGMTGAGWNCVVNNLNNTGTCTRSDALAGGASYPTITVLVNVAANATSPQLNQVTVSGGGAESVISWDPTVISSAVRPTRLGTVQNGRWFIDTNGNGAFDNGVDQTFNWWGGAGSITVVGDWNGTGKSKAGFFKDGLWYLDYDGNGFFDGGVVDKVYGFGWSAPGITPIVGDWNGDGRTKVGVFYNGFWYIDYNGNGVWDGPVTDRLYGWGWNGVTPLVGDWNGDGRTKIGFFVNGFWYLDYDGNGIWDNGVVDKAYSWGWSAVTPVVGDWSGNGKTKIGFFINGFWYLDYDGNGIWDNGVVDKLYSFGWTGVTPQVGDWSADGRSKIGIFINGFWYLDYNGNGIWESGADKVYGWGQAGDTPATGRW